MSDERDVRALRGRIDALDAEIVRLLHERARLALRIGGLKRALGLPVHDPVREKEILAAVQRAGSGPLAPDAVKRLYERILDESRHIERVAAEGGAAGEGPTGKEPHG